MRSFMVFTRKISLVSDGDFYTHNITDEVLELVTESNIQEGIMVVSYQHTTGAVIIAEHEAGMLVDLENSLSKFSLKNYNYKHHLRGYDKNGLAHIQSALLGVSISIPITEGRLDLGDYQEILVIDFDEKTKKRQLVVKVIGDYGSN